MSDCHVCFLFNYVFPSLRDANRRRVHVSSRTLSFLGDQFEVEAAHGEKREQVLRTAGIETYFILSARNPVNILLSIFNLFIYFLKDLRLLELQFTFHVGL